MRKLTKGQSLIEVLVSITIVVMLAVSLITTTLITQKTSRSARDNTVAAKLAQEYIEQARVIRDNKGFSAISDGCYVINGSDPNTWQLVSCVPGDKPVLNNVTFTRKIDVSGRNDKSKQVKVTVNWTDSSGTRTVTNTTILSDCVSTSC